MSDRPRLSPETLASLPPDVARPGYDRRAVKTGVVHLGVGAFHRAHQAFVFDRLLAAGDPRWGVTGASMHSPAARDALAPQDGLFTLVERDGSAERLRVIGSIRDVLVAPENPRALIEAMAAPDVRLVTLTITEKGYDGPAIEVIADALALRRARGLAPFTAISCDNIAGNGARLARAVLALATIANPRLHDWIAEYGAFPSTMVDRITPATTEADIEALAGRIGVLDRAMVKTEPFWQWVIEDRFAGPRPAFEAVGAQMVADVAPWETAKLRLLNGAHSAMAYLGGLAGLRFVHEFVGDAVRVDFINRLWDETETTLTPTPGLDIPAYRAALLARFANPALNHALRQIAMDGSQKLPQRLVAPFAARAAQGLPSPALALAISGWMKWQGGRTDAGEAFAVDDQLAGQTRRIASAVSAADRVAGFLSLSAVFPPQLADHAGALTAALEGLDHHGASQAMRRWNPSPLWGKAGLGVFARAMKAETLMDAGAQPRLSLQPRGFTPIQPSPIEGEGFATQILSVIPPSAAMAWPVTKPPSSEARNSATRATSTGSPRRRSTDFLAQTAATSGFSKLCRVMPVRIAPGSTALAVTPHLPSSSARVRVRPTTPAFDAQ